MAKASSTAVTPHELTVVSAPNNALTGSIEELSKAADQIGANMAVLQLNGWDTVQKCKAAFWLAHGKAEHPAVFMENHYVMVVKGRLTIEPKWEYMIRKLTETIPGFTWEVLEETDEACTVRMTDGRSEHKVRYTVADAKRQGLFGRSAGNMWTEGSTREGCFKQAVKRCARRIGVGRAGWVDVEGMELPESGAEVVEDGPGGPALSSDERGKAASAADRDPGPSQATPAEEAGSEAGGAAPSPTPATPPAKKSANPVMELSTALVKRFGKMPKADALKKAADVYNQMISVTSGSSPNVVFKSADEIPPFDAQRMIEFLPKYEEQPKYPPKNVSVPLVVDPEAPPLEPAPEPEKLVEVEGRPYDDLMDEIKRARKLFDRKFSMEAPPGSGKVYFIDGPTLGQVGLDKSIVLSDQGEIMASESLIAHLAKVLKEACDQKERGR